MNKYEYVIGLDISSVNTGITIINLSTKDYKAYAVDTKKYSPLQNIFLKHLGKEYKDLIDTTKIEFDITKIIIENFKPYYEYAKAIIEKKQAGEETEELEPLIVHIVPEKAYIPFGEGMKFTGSGKTLKYSGMYLTSLISALTTLSFGQLIPIYNPVMPNTWKAKMKVSGADKGKSIAKAKELGLWDDHSPSTNDNIADSFLIANWYIANKYDEVKAKWALIQKDLTEHKIKEIKKNEKQFREEEENATKN